MFLLDKCFYAIIGLVYLIEFERCISLCEHSRVSCFFLQFRFASVNSYPDFENIAWLLELFESDLQTTFMSLI